MAYLALARKFAPWLAFALLIAAVGYLRLDSKAKAAKLELAESRVADVEDANRFIRQALDAVAAQRADNDAIAADVAARLSGNAVREVHTQTVIEKAIFHDPTSRNWADEPIPDSLRAGLSAD